MFLLFLLFLSVFPLSAADSQDDLGDISFNLKTINRSLREIDAACKESESKYLSVNISESVGSKVVESTVKKGDFFFEKGDYASAATIFYSVVVLRSEKDSVWLDALSKLADSLMRQKNYISAIRYFEMLAVVSENEKYRIKGLKGLITASYSLGDYAAARKYYSRFLENGYNIAQDPELLYYLGKSLFYDGHFDDAEKLFSAVKKGSGFYPQSLYFLGIIAIKGMKYHEALAFYEEIISLEDDGSYRYFDRIRELSVLAAARLALEINDLEKAVLYYVMIDKYSEFFAEAHYELSWVYIKQEDYGRAVESLRLIKYIAPDSIVAPRAEILEGSILVRARRFGEAMVLFDSIVEKYGKIQEELFLIDSKSFLTSGTSGKLSDVLLPYSPIIQSLLKDSKKFSNTVTLNDTILNLEEELKNIVSMENKISAIVENDNAASLFPPLKSGAEIALFLRNRLAAIRNNLTLIRKSIVWSSLDEEQREKFNALEEKKGKIMGFLENSQFSASRIEERAAEYANRIIEISEATHRISLIINSLSKDLESVVIFYAKEKNLSKEYEPVFLGRVNRERERIKKMIAESEEYRKELEAEKNRLMLGGDMIEKEIVIRDSLNSIVDEQNAILTLVKTSKYPEISTLMAEADRIDRELGIFYLNLNEAMHDLLNTMKISYEKERSNLEEYKSQLMNVKREVEEMAVLAMYSNLNMVQNTFADLVMQGDLGIIDVAWEKKDENSSAILRMKTQKAEEIQQLYFYLDGEK